MRGMFLPIILMTLLVSACLLAGCGKKGDPQPLFSNLTALSKPYLNQTLD